ncbi:MAG TPA: ATP synthase F1 subunit epsilon [Leptospiraceae bacterium]|nr:ATP synthase F1 subunit epsilon [Leptospiraceae bacterium]HMW04937.1 ATP synthase F1 subunit epsilon [Leptospiraceae bacterium]HMX31914.1 ATP synthase F1 subunit epsilon [Leptospiraceae bacterium]HMY30842.1 ATP synthase F1 subunit epsilon [Leptospiraceae bacterium]HMZ62646.1 ATP synthase F1 subunit epsilon [Leptospiraceae bacterium]
MSDSKLTLSVISPEKEIFSGKADYVNLPGAMGYFGVLINHTPIVSELEYGILEVKLDGKIQKIVVDGGFAEVKSNQIKVLTNGGDLKENIDPVKSEADLEKAIESSSKTRDLDIKKAKSRVLIHKS